ncbi:hypothetical protein Tco_1192510 [Tanacetum coccineum]
MSFIGMITSSLSSFGVILSGDLTAVERSKVWLVSRPNRLCAQALIGDGHPCLSIHKLVRSTPDGHFLDAFIREDEWEYSVSGDDESLVGIFWKILYESPIKTPIVSSHLCIIFLKTGERQFQREFPKDDEVSIKTSLSFQPCRERWPTYTLWYVSVALHKPKGMRRMLGWFIVQNASRMRMYRQDHNMWINFGEVVSSSFRARKGILLLEQIE